MSRNEKRGCQCRVCRAVREIVLVPVQVDNLPVQLWRYLEKRARDMGVTVEQMASIIINSRES